MRWTDRYRFERICSVAVATMCIYADIYQYWTKAVSVALHTIHWLLKKMCWIRKHLVYAQWVFSQCYRNTLFFYKFSKYFHMLRFDVMLLFRTNEVINLNYPPPFRIDIEYISSLTIVLSCLCLMYEWEGT